MAFGESLKNFLVGSPGQQMQFNRFTPQQSNLQNQSIQQILSLLQNGGAGAGNNVGGLGAQFNFEPIANRARSDFQTKTLPLLSERFNALGSNKRSSGLNGQAFQAAQGLEEGLAGLQSKYNLAAGGQQNQLLSLLLSLAMQPSFETGYRPGTSGLLGGLAGGLGQGLGTLGSLAPLQYLGLL
jgi:hypothetical protein